MKVKCNQCNTIFDKLPYEVKRTKHNFCNLTCKGLFDRSRVQAFCANCGKHLPDRTPSMILKNVFCNHSCSATFNNKNKLHGTRRSKLEQYIESCLREAYPDLEFAFNKKDAIGSELDIYIPSLKLAFELNGPVHYEPIFGQDKLQQVQNNDNNKFQACIASGISLCIIDVSKVKYMKPSRCEEFLNIIISIINTKIGEVIESND